MNLVDNFSFSCIFCIYSFIASVASKLCSTHLIISCGYDFLVNLLLCEQTVPLYNVYVDYRFYYRLICSASTPAAVIVELSFIKITYFSLIKLHVLLCLYAIFVD